MTRPYRVVNKSFFKDLLASIFSSPELLADICICTAVGKIRWVLIPWEDYQSYMNPDVPRSVKKTDIERIDYKKNKNRRRPACGKWRY